MAPVKQHTDDWFNQMSYEKRIEALLAITDLIIPLDEDTEAFRMLVDHYEQMVKIHGRLGSIPVKPPPKPRAPQATSQGGPRPGTSRQRSPQPSTSWQSPPKPRASSQMPPRSKTSSQVPPKPRASSQVPPKPRASSQVPPRPKTSSQSPPKQTTTIKIKLASPAKSKECPCPEADGKASESDMLEKAIKARAAAVEKLEKVRKKIESDKQVASATRKREERRARRKQRGFPNPSSPGQPLHDYEKVYLPVTKESLSRLQAVYDSMSPGPTRDQWGKLVKEKERQLKYGTPPTPEQYHGFHVGQYENDPESHVNLRSRDDPARYPSPATKRRIQQDEEEDARQLQEAMQLEAQQWEDPRVVDEKQRQMDEEYEALLFGDTPARYRGDRGIKWYKEDPAQKQSQPSKIPNATAKPPRSADLRTPDDNRGKPNRLPKYFSRAPLKMRITPGQDQRVRKQLNPETNLEPRPTQGFPRTNLKRARREKELDRRNTYKETAKLPLKRFAPPQKTDTDQGKGGKCGCSQKNKPASSKSHSVSSGASSPRPRSTPRSASPRRTIAPSPSGTSTSTPKRTRSSPSGKLFLPISPDEADCELEVLEWMQKNSIEAIQAFLSHSFTSPRSGKKSGSCECPSRTSNSPPSTPKRQGGSRQNTPTSQNSMPTPTSEEIHTMYNDFHNQYMRSPNSKKTTDVLKDWMREYSDLESSYDDGLPSPTSEELHKLMADVGMDILNDVNSSPNSVPDMIEFSPPQRKSRGCSCSPKSVADMIEFSPPQRKSRGCSCSPKSTGSSNRDRRIAKPGSSRKSSPTRGDSYEVHGMVNGFEVHQTGNEFHYKYQSSDCKTTAEVIKDWMDANYPLDSPDDSGLPVPTPEELQKIMEELSADIINDYVNSNPSSVEITEVSPRQGKSRDCSCRSTESPRISTPGSAR